MENRFLAKKEASAVLGGPFSTQIFIPHTSFWTSNVARQALCWTQDRNAMPRRGHDARCRSEARNMHHFITVLIAVASALSTAPAAASQNCLAIF